MKTRLVTSMILGVIGLVTAGLIGAYTPAVAADDVLAKLDDDVALARHDDDDDDGDDDDDTNGTDSAGTTATVGTTATTSTAGTGTGTATASQTGGTDDATTGDATNSVTTDMSKDADLSVGDLSVDMTNDGPGDTLTVDETGGHTNDASRHDTRG